MTVLASLEPASLEVAPGSAATVTLRVRNRGTIVERFELQVVGPTAGWARVDPPALRLFPDEEGQATVTFTPPRAPTPEADTYPFGLAIRAAADPEATTVEEGKITVSPFVELRTQIVPQTSKGSRSGSHVLTVDNLGNAVADVSVSATDPDALLRFDVQPPRMGLRPAASGKVRARAVPLKTFFTGSAQRIPFTIQLVEPTAGPQQVGATLEQRAILPPWLRPAILTAVAAAVLLFVVPGALGLDVPWPQVIAKATPEPTPTPPPPTPTPEVTEAPTPEVTVEPTLGPTPVPTPGPPDEIVFAGLTGDLNGGMSLTLNPVCQADFEKCKAEAFTRVQLLLNNLQNVADGARLTTFEGSSEGTLPDQIGTLPLILTWDNPRYPYAQSGTLKGFTDKIAIDLAPLMASGQATATISRDPLIEAYILPHDGADILFKLIYLYTPPIPTPTPAPTPAGGVSVLYAVDYSTMRLSDSSLLSAVKLYNP